MARDISSRLILKGDLISLTPLHVGGYGEDVDTDLPLARNGEGQWYIPGTSLAGAMRNWCEDVFGIIKVNHVWGFQQDDHGHASHIFIDDSVIEDIVLIEIRDGVGIDREWGSAAENIKFDRAILPRGTKLPFHLDVEIPSFWENNSSPSQFALFTREVALSMVAALHEALTAGEIRLGASKTRGMGRIRLEGASFFEQLFDNRDILVTLKQNNNGFMVKQEDIIQAHKKYPAKQIPGLDINIMWKPLSPLMVKSGFEGIAADMLPLVSGLNGGVAPVLPGSSIKGALRSQAERIVRTLLHRDVFDISDPKKRFMEQVKLPLIDSLFGTVGESKSERAERSRTENENDPLPGLGALGIDDCYMNCTLSEKQCEDILDSKDDSTLRQSLDNSCAHNWQHAYHVAVDRWTGGAAEGALYTVLEPHNTAWEPLQLSLNLSRISENDKYPVLTLLLLTLRDLAQGRIPIGFGTHRGMGAVEVESVEFKARGSDNPFGILDGFQLKRGRLNDLPHELHDLLQNEWRAWTGTKIRRCHIKNFTVFKDQEIEFCSGINVIIGANSTGKSHLLKILYALTQWMTSKSFVTDKKQELLFDLFNGLFRPEKGDISLLL